MEEHHVSVREFILEDRITRPGGFFSMKSSSPISSLIYRSIFQFPVPRGSIHGSAQNEVYRRRGPRLFHNLKQQLQYAGSY